MHIKDGSSLSLVSWALIGIILSVLFRVNNCVGFSNYKYFYLFLLYTVVSSLWFCLSSLYDIIHLWVGGRGRGKGFERERRQNGLTSVPFILFFFAEGRRQGWLSQQIQRHILLRHSWCIRTVHQLSPHLPHLSRLQQQDYNRYL